MIISEAHRQFRFIIDKADGVNYPNFRPEEIDLLLNIAQDRYVKQRYGLNNPKRLGIEQDQKRTEDLRNLIKQTVIQTFTNANYENISINTIRIALDSDHWFTIQEDAIINYPGCNTTITVPLYNPDNPFGGRAPVQMTGVSVDVIPITHLEYNKVIKDPFKAPDNTKILRLMYKGYSELILPSGASMVFYKSRYIKKPTRVSLTGNTTFDLADHTHSEIVDMAVQIALENIEAKRSVTFDKIANTNE